MHQTTCGETHKIEIFEGSNVSKFLLKEKETFELYKEKSNCLYSNTRIIDNPTVNYLNEFFSKSVHLPEYQLKSILKKEYDDCEKIYPYLGEVFLNLFFDKDLLADKNVHLFRKDTVEEFLETSKDENAKSIVRWIVQNSSTDRIVEIESSFGESISIKKENDIFVKIEFDSSFLGNKKSLEMKDYRFAIIDGYIESVSEIHHMLHFAAMNKEPHVLFCFGMSDEVKNVIIQNNAKKITQIFPVSMKVTEDTINIMNDIALLHSSDIISSLKGQTISQEMRKELKKGNTITFTRDGFKLTPCCSLNDIKLHINFLQNRIKNSAPDANIEIIENRIKNLNSKVLKVYVPEELKKDIGFNRDLDYLLRMLDTSLRGYVKLSFDKRHVMVPSILYSYAIKKVNATKLLFYNIDKILIRKE